MVMRAWSLILLRLNSRGWTQVKAASFNHQPCRPKFDEDPAHHHTHAKSMMLKGFCGAASRKYLMARWFGVAFHREAWEDAVQKSSKNFKEAIHI